MHGSDKPVERVYISKTLQRYEENMNNKMINSSLASLRNGSLQMLGNNENEIIIEENEMTQETPHLQKEGKEHRSTFKHEMT